MAGPSAVTLQGPGPRDGEPTVKGVRFAIMRRMVQEGASHALAKGAVLDRIQHVPMPQLINELTRREPRPALVNHHAQEALVLHDRRGWFTDGNLLKRLRMLAGLLLLR